MLMLKCLYSCFYYVITMFDQYFLTKIPQNTTNINQGVGATIAMLCKVAKMEPDATAPP